MKHTTCWFAVIAVAPIGALGVWGSPVYAQETITYTFAGGADGGNPNGLIMDKKGNFYGTTAGGGNLSTNGGYGSGVVFKVTPSGSETALYTFSGGVDGDYPNASSLIMDKKGNLYGTTLYGGSAPGANGFGVVFKVDKKGHESVLYTFTGGADGSNPSSSLVMDKKGNLYGTTGYGGDLSTDDGSGSGVVFMLDKKGHETVLYSFSGDTDGGIPQAGLIMDKKGNLYGTTADGGDHSTNGGYGSGVVFELSSPYGQSNETVLYSFSGGADGALPYAGVTMDTQGNLYGTTLQGGDRSVFSYGAGAVFKLSPPYGQSNVTVLHTFTGGAGGANPWAGGVIVDKQGNLYGTTFDGGSSDSNRLGGVGYGVVYEMSPLGSESVLYTFGGGTDGSNPYAGLVMDKSGNLYGTTLYGGNLSSYFGYGSGVVFKLSP